MCNKKNISISELDFKDSFQIDITKSELHIYGKNIVCSTNKRGHSMPIQKGIDEIVLDARKGFIPLWNKNITLRWRFNNSINYFKEPEKAKTYIRTLFNEAVRGWGKAKPVDFKEVRSLWDFEICINQNDQCYEDNLCTMGKSFFPNGGQNEFVFYPKLFNKYIDYEEKVNIIAHELGHIFGLRHFFAQIDEKEYKSIIYGNHQKFSIMNYGKESVLTDNDISDLNILYDKVWSGSLTELNGTPIKLVNPFHYYTDE
ncbi:matrixin family metalloprotease [Winogradskyella flava]|uniref:Matrixin family metalloprotease n=1 Tax=Winogradskyella flava TaxID=1884876 RepID=A0A842IPY9_9FLAO|nr:matrixin family metalloprotease [Winogradskyella flava]MBC2845070.1 matrixin family metalloprotease [Winogradskyella flava]